MAGTASKKIGTSTHIKSSHIHCQKIGVKILDEIVPAEEFNLTMEDANNWVVEGGADNLVTDTGP